MNKSQLEMYIENQEELLKKHDGQIIAVKDGQFLGSFESKLDAYRYVTNEGLQDGEYIIVKCTQGDSAYTSYFANWFAFEESTKETHAKI